MDVDDVMLPDRVTKLYTDLINSENSIAFGGYIEVNKHGNHIVHECTTSSVRFAGPWNTLMYSEVIPSSGKLFNEGVYLTSDLVLWKELQYSGYSFTYSPGSLVHQYCYRADSYTSLFTEEQRKEYLKQKCLAELPNELKKSSARLHADCSKLVSVVVVCHEPYITLLDRCLLPLNENSFLFKERIIVFDSCKEIPKMEDWVVKQGNWSNPNLARNHGLEDVTAKWVLFVDADNQLTAAYITSMVRAIQRNLSSVGILYGDIQFTDINNVATHKIITPEFDDWNYRQVSYCDTSSFWRTATVKDEKWSKVTKCYDDYNLALRVTRSGWVGKKINCTLTLTEHNLSLRRSQAGIVLNDERIEYSLWHTWNLTVVCAMAGRSELLDEWSEYLKTETFPRNTRLVFINNSNSLEFTDKLHQLMSDLRYKFSSVSISHVGVPYVKPLSGGYMDADKHQHVADLYNSVLPDIRTDLVLFLEDDVFPSVGSLRKLHSEIRPSNRVAAVGGSYRSPNYPHLLCAATSTNDWSARIIWSEKPINSTTIGMIGGGYTLYANWALQYCLPFTAIENNKVNGWDTNLNIKLRQLGYILKLRGDVVCKHRTPNIKQYVEFIEQKPENY